MSLATNIANLATRVATEVKGVRTLINGNAADLSALDTTAKSNLVAAINELHDALGDAGASIDDSTAATTTTYSSSKIQDLLSAAIDDLVASAPGTLDTLKELADALGDDANFATTMTTALGNRVRVDTATQGLTSTEQSNARTNIGAVSSTAVGDTTTDLVAVFEAGL